MRLPTVPLVIVAAVLAVAAPAASAVECGTVDPETRQVSRATLTLDDTSTTNLAAERDTDPMTLLLRFTAAGCELPAGGGVPEWELQPKTGEDELPRAALSEPTAEVDGQEYTVRFIVDPARFDAGSYGGFVQLRTPFARTARTPFTASRSEDSLLWPILFGVAGGLAGMIWFVLLKRAKGAKSRIGLIQYVIVALAAAAAGCFAVLTAYFDQDVWSIEANWFGALVAAGTGATTGAMAAAIAVLWREPDPEPRPAPAR